MLVLGWLTVLLGVFAILWGDGAFAKRGLGQGLRRVMRVDPTGKTLKGPFGYGSYRRRFWGREFEAASEKLINGNVLLR